MSHKSSKFFLLIIVSVTILFASAGLQAKGAVQAGQVAINGILRDGNGAPRQGTFGITFTLYSSQTDGDLLWREDQVIQTDEHGRYAVNLGAAEKEGLLSDLFGNGTVLWLGIQVQGEEERARVELDPNSYSLRDARAVAAEGRPLLSFAVDDSLVNLEGRRTPAGVDPAGTSKGARALASGGFVGPFDSHESDGNTWFGWSSGLGPPSSSANYGSFFGAYAGYKTTTGQYNTFIGAGAGQENVAGSRNTYVGEVAGQYSDTSDNSFFGYAAGGNFNNSGSPNSFFGSQAGATNTTGSNNSFFGYHAGIANTTGRYGSIFGDQAGSALNGLVYSNAFFGYSAGVATTSGSYNAFLGTYAGSANKAGHDNTFVGQQAGEDNTSGGFNTFVGEHAGDINTIEDNNTAIGAYTNTTAGITNATAIGYQAKVTASNSLVLGSINGVNGATADTKVGIGTNAPVSHLNVRSASNLSPRGVTNEQYNDGMDGVQFRGRKARGTSTTPAAVQIGDVLGNYIFDAYDGAGFFTGVQIRPVTEEAWTSTAHGAYLALWTTPSGTTTNTEKMRITGAGNVGIGIANPTERLHVVGNLKVSGGGIYGTLIGPASPDTDVPDYVFEPDYKLMSLQELERFVSDERHLPNIPKASEIREQGVNVNEFQMKLLEKIEELTLYTVQQEKTIREQQARLTTIEQMLSRQQAQQQK